MTEILD